MLEDELLKQIIENNNITTYSNKLPKLIDENFKKNRNNNELIKTLSLRIICNCIPLNWKQYKLNNCPLCYKKWTNPIMHIFTNCNHLNESNLCKTDKRIIKLESIINIVYEIVNKNYEEILKITTEIEKKYEMKDCDNKK